MGWTPGPGRSRGHVRSRKQRHAGGPLPGPLAPSAPARLLICCTPTSSQIVHLDPGNLMGVPESVRDALADRYAIERELGRGGMAIVYLAKDLRHDRPVALKVLLPELAATLGPERFQREI